ncbi:hypothetical protein B0J17DRAFT_633146 [Rhizoctonia solani]|nr:hypothetical protein B0J17DRAFT_633146 [Rhizoctonia solani]
MTTGAFGMSGKEQLSLTLAQCLIQGILVSLLATFLSTRSTRPPSFTVDLNNPNYGPARYGSVSGIVIGTGVQAFFVHRCWKILKKRVLPVLPLISLVLAGLTAGVLIVVYKAQLTTAYLAQQANPQDGALLLALQAADRRLRIALTVWAFSWFVLDLGMTVITTVFLYRIRTGLPAHDGIFRTVWRALWTSVTPPLILMAIIIVDGKRITQSEQHPLKTPGSPTAVSRVTVGIAAMPWSFAYQGLIREKFDRSRPSPLCLAPNKPGAVISEALFARDMDIESPGSPNAENRHSVCDTSSTKFGSVRIKQEQEGDVEKYPMPATPPAASSGGPQQICFSA